MNRFGKLIIIPCLTAALAFAGCTDNGATDDQTTPWTESGDGETTSSAEKETNGQPETFAPKDHEEMTEAELLADRGGKRPQEGYNRLQSIALITDELIKGSDGKLDKDEPCGKLPSFLVPEGEGIIVLRDWNTTDMSAYLENGEIVFMAKNQTGNGNFRLGVQDCDRDRAKGRESVTVYREAGDYGDITDEWTEIRIPFKDYFDGENGLDVSCIWTLRIGASVKGTRIADMRIESPDTEKSSPAVKVNQLGYRTGSAKYAYVSGFYELLSCNSRTQFRIVDKESGMSVYAGTLSLVDGYDEKYSGETVYAADFSDFDTEGKYYIEVDAPGIESSASFEIGDEIYGGLLAKACKYYYFQRANVELTEEYAGKWARKAMYADDSSMKFLSDKNKTKDVSGGWFDAGDFGKYVDPGASAATDLLWAYKEFPGAFSDGMENIPESGNGIPDILDEIKVELDFILKMQDKSDGGFYHRVNPDDGKRAIVDTFSGGDKGNVKATGTTADAAAALAFASTVYKEFDADYAQTLLEAAVAGWKYTCLNTDVASSGTYGSDKTEPQRFWAACSLYYATGEEEYHTYIRREYSKYKDAYGTDDFGHGSDNMKKIAYITYLASEKPDAGIVKWIEKEFKTWKNAMLSNASLNAWNTALPEWALWWGSNSNAMNVGMEMYLHEKYLGTDTETSRRLCAETLNFMLGINPLGKSMVTGIGENSIARTYSGIFGEDGLEGYPDGYTPGGINMYDGAILSRFAGKCYSDTKLDWVTNENSIYYQAALVFDAAMQANTIH